MPPRSGEAFGPTFREGDGEFGPLHSLPMSIGVRLICASQSRSESNLGNVTPVHEHESNNWGPTKADQIIAGHGGWRNPQPAVDKVTGTTKRNPGVQ